MRFFGMNKKSNLYIEDGEIINNWYIACLSKELNNSRPISKIIYDTPLVLFRDSQNKVICLPDRCIHRHTLLSEGELSNNGQLVCPYHGWHYDSEGKVTHIPSEGPDTKPSRSLF